MNLSTSIKTCLRQYFDFSGRATRSEFWWFHLFLFVGSGALLYLDAIVFGTAQSIDPFSALFSLLTFFPAMSVRARRLHDINVSGWWQMLPLLGLLILAPGFYNYFINSVSAIGPLMALSVVGGVLVFFGGFVLLIIGFCLPSTNGANRFGDAPSTLSNSHYLSNSH